MGRTRSQDWRPENNNRRTAKRKRGEYQTPPWLADGWLASLIGQTHCRSKNQTTTHTHTHLLPRLDALALLGQPTLADDGDVVQRQFKARAIGGAWSVRLPRAATATGGGGTTEVVKEPANTGQARPGSMQMRGHQITIG